MDWLLSARRGNLDLLLDAVNPRLGEPAYYDVFARAGGEVAGRGRLEVSTFHFSDDIRFTQEEDGATSRVNNQYLWAKWTTEADGLIQQTVFSTGKVDRRHTVTPTTATDWKAACWTSYTSERTRSRTTASGDEGRNCEYLQLVRFDNNAWSTRPISMRFADLLPSHSVNPRS